jgi:DNA-binding MarR family transcriptional regulator
MSPLVEQPHLDAWRALLNAHASMTRHIEEALSKAGLPPLGWYDVLWPVYQAKGRRMRMRDLSENVVTISRSGLTRLVDRIVDAGMLERDATPGDRRGTDVVLTDEGERLLRRMWPVYAEVVNAHFAGPLPKSRAEHLRDSLRRVG